MIDEDVIARVAALLGTRVWEKKPSKAHYQLQYTTQVSGPRARKLAELLLPHMGARRREQIQRALSAVAERAAFGPPDRYD